MNVRKAVQTLVLAAFPIATVAIGCSSGTGDVGHGTCASVCANQPTCSGSTPTTCLTQCSQLQTQCTNEGQGPAANFQQFLDCANGISSSQYSCSPAGGVQVDTNQCAQQETTALQGCGSVVVTNDGGHIETGTCSSVCANQPSCSGSTPTSCVTECGQLQAQCTNAGHGSDFQNYLECASGISSSQYSCSPVGGVQVNTAQCAQQEATVVQSCLDGGSGFDTGSGGSDTGVNEGSCTSVCALEPAACSSNCISECAQLLSQCASAGQSAVFQSFLSCASSNYTASDFTCNGATVVNSSSACNSQITALSACTGSTTFDSGPPDSATGDAACLANPSTCVTCCANNHQAGVGVLDQAILTCDCGTGAGGCQTACATEICANPPAAPTAGDACDTCLNTSLGMTGACLQPVETACQANADCAAYLTCSNQTGCM